MIQVSSRKSRDGLLGGVMHPDFISIEKTGVSDAVARCSRALRQGKLLVLPTETVYGLGALASNADAVARLCQRKERRQGHALPLAVSGFKMVKEYVADFPPIAERLARRFWPGPLTIVVNLSQSEDKLKTFPEDSLRAIAPQNTCGFRAPQNDFLLSVINAVNAPLVLTSANISGRSPATSAQEAKEALGDRVDLVVDGGIATYGTPSTVVKVIKNEISILREGALSLDALRDATIKTTLFVCAANLCRSPVAEAIARKLVAEELNTPPESIEARGIRVESAGIYASDSRPAPSSVCRLMQKLYGLALDSHRSKGVDASLIRDADNIFTMEKTQCLALQSLYPEHADRIATLDPSGCDVADPFGGPGKGYRVCFKRIESLVKSRLSQILKE